jgi:hypothetical protein
METSPWEAFLLSFSLALRAAADGKAPVGAAPEALTLANEVLQELRELQTANDLCDSRHPGHLERAS